MIRFLLRSLGFVLMAAAFAALVVDGSRSIAGGRPLFYSVGDAAAWLGGLHASAAPAAWPAPIREIAEGVLAVPAWIAATLLGLALLYAGRPPAIGFSRRRS